MLPQWLTDFNGATGTYQCLCISPVIMKLPCLLEALGIVSWKRELHIGQVELNWNRNRSEEQQQRWQIKGS